MSGQFQVYCKVNQIYIYTCVCVCLYTCTNVYPLFFQIHLPNRSYRVLRRVSVLYSRSLLIIYFICSSVYIREGNGTPLQYSCLENPMDGGAWQAEVHGVTKSRTRLSNFTFTFHFHALGRKWQPTPVFFPGESQGWQSLVGCRLWVCRESDTTKATQQQQQQCVYVNPSLPMYPLLPPFPTGNHSF